MITQAEQDCLRKFQRVCAQLQECRFVRTLSSIDHSITIDQDPSKCRVPVYDKDDFRAFATHFRKLDSEGEPTYFFKILKIISRYSGPDVQSALSEIRKLVVEEQVRPMLGISFGINGAEEEFSPKRIRNAIFNGEIFHSADDVEVDRNTVAHFEPFAMASFLRYAMFMVNYSTHICGSQTLTELISVTPSG